MGTLVYSVLYIGRSYIHSTKYRMNVLTVCIIAVTVSSSFAEEESCLMEDTILHGTHEVYFPPVQSLIIFDGWDLRKCFGEYGILALCQRHCAQESTCKGWNFKDRQCYIFTEVVLHKKLPDGYPVFMFGNSNVSGYRCKVTAKEILEMKNKYCAKTVVHGPRCRSS